MGLEELSGYDRVGEILEDAAASGALQPGKQGWKIAVEGLCKSVLLGPAPGTPNRSWLSLIVEERVRMWVAVAHPPELREMRAAVADELLIAPSPPAAQELEAVLQPLRWLLEACRRGVSLTQSGYLPPTLVHEALGLFGWWPEWLGRPRSEADVHQLGQLREVASRLRLMTKRGRRLTTSASRVRLLDDPVALWGALAGSIGCADRYSSMLSELIAHRLLRGPAEEHDLTSEIVPIITAQGWSSGGAPLEPRRVGYSIHEPLREWRLFGLLNEQEPRWHQGQQTVRWVISLTPAGRTTALAQLHARATGPRHDTFV